jgi:hypothetical protein
VSTSRIDRSPFARGASTGALAAGALGVHLAVQRLAPPARYHAGDGLVEIVPFLPWTVWTYLFFFPLVVATAVLVPPERYRRLVAAWALAAGVTWTLVLLVPVTFARPDAAAIEGPLHRWAFGAIHGIDARHVTFPCLHAAATWISWLALRDREPWLRRALFVLAVAITFSTMTTRQHLLTDNVAGIALAWVCSRAVLGPRAAGAAAVLTAVASTSPGRARRAPRSR